MHLKLCTYHSFHQFPLFGHLGCFQFLPIDLKDAYAGVPFKICNSWGGLDMGIKQLEWTVVTMAGLATACVPIACTFIFVYTP